MLGFSQSSPEPGILSSNASRLFPRALLGAPAWRGLQTSANHELTRRRTSLLSCVISDVCKITGRKGGKGLVPRSSRTNFDELVKLAGTVNYCECIRTSICRRIGCRRVG